MGDKGSQRDHTTYGSESAGGREGADGAGGLAEGVAEHY